jgi:hypothetical protein
MQEVQRFAAGRGVLLTVLEGLAGLGILAEAEVAGKP